MYIKETILGYALQVLEQFKRLIMSNQRASVTTGYADKWDVVLLGGLIGSLFSFLQFVVSPKIGRASDRLGRRTVLLYTMVSCGFIQFFFLKKKTKWRFFRWAIFYPLWFGCLPAHSVCSWSLELLLV